MSVAAPRADDERPVAGYALRIGRGLLEAIAPVGVDELLDADGRVRPASRDLGASIDLLGPAGLAHRRSQAARLAEDDGVTYGLADSARAARRWLVDPLPLALDAGEWAGLEAGLIQRARLLDLVLTDLYGPRTLLRDGLLPAAAVLAHSGFLREADGIRVPGAHQLFLAATDLGRDASGRWHVLADRTQAPSGAGYAMANRRIVSQVMPGLHRDTRLARLRGFFHDMRASLQQIAPSGTEAPRVVLLTPGPGAETAFDQSFVATLLGFPLVTGEDLVVQDGRVWMRGLSRLEPVDVILRRVDAAFADPLDLRPDSRLGVPGLLDAARRGQVSIVNPLGSGVLENPALAAHLPALAQRLLGEPLRLPSPRAWWCGDPAHLREVQARFAGLVVRPLARGAGTSSRVVAELSSAQRTALAARIAAEPALWCAQEPLALSTAPIVTDGALEPRPVVLRGFAVSRGDGYQVMPGGLARLAGRPGTQVVTSALGAVAKDVWVPAAQSVPGAAAAVDVAGHDTGDLAAEAALSPVPRAAEDLYWLGRYGERAEGVVRLLRVTDDLAEDWSRRPGSAGAAALRVVLDVLAEVTGVAEADGSGGPQAGLLRHAVDAATPGTLGFAVRRTVDTAHAVREQLSLDTWLVLGGLDRVLGELDGLAGQAAPGLEPALRPTLARVLEGLLALAGIGAESMVRDSAHAFMEAGRRVERALHVIGVLRGAFGTVAPPAVEAMVLEPVLVAGESIITYRRRAAVRRLGATGPGTAADVLELLLLDRTNPRAVAYQLDRLTDALRALPPAVDDGVRGTREDLTGALLAIQAAVREASPAQWCTPGPDGRRAVLRARLDELTAGLSALSSMIETVYFRRPAPLRPLSAASGRWLR
ncbi:circularly permuted type 2 ATP-grasp protein [Dactylosporangium darangshiense]|uniref:Circularly permuted type 2 ATP-grasp protein n=1 Tax=Dactylosporangium darangshiense TaxID=579108 RepID=A0ABP8DHD4_9ACTN